MFFKDLSAYCFTKHVNKFSLPFHSANGLPPLPPKLTHDSRALKINSGGVGNSIDLTDDATEECTMTTTDDDDAEESTAVANRVRRLAIARAQSCPNTPPLLDYHAVTIRNTNSSAITQEDNSDIDEVFSPLTLPLKQTDGQTAQSSREKKHSRYSRSETSGASYSVSESSQKSLSFSAFRKRAYFTKHFLNYNPYINMTWSLSYHRGI